jgi:16S rRNA A1518/A1519 N6-dimethyltransferase RsmA/KsgA/DIM1 with predicted DNA glycosylase/AP lyase activity
LITHFAKRRKMMRSAISEIFGGSAAAEAALIRAGIDPTIRGEALTVAHVADCPANKLIKQYAFVI